MFKVGLGFLVIAMTGCGVRHQSTSDTEQAIGTAKGAQVLVSLADASAKELYKSLKAKEVVNNLNKNKKWTGQATISCSVPKFDGAIGPISCLIIDKSNQEVASLADRSATDFYKAFNVPEVVNSLGKSKTWKGNVTISCSASNFDGATGPFMCSIEKK